MTIALLSKTYRVVIENSLSSRALKTVVVWAMVFSVSFLTAGCNVESEQFIPRVEKAKTLTITRIKGNQDAENIKAPPIPFIFQDLTDADIDWLANTHVYPWLEDRLGKDWKDNTTKWAQIIECRKWAHAQLTMYDKNNPVWSDRLGYLRFDSRGWPYGLSDRTHPRAILAYANGDPNNPYPNTAGGGYCDHSNKLFMAALHTIGVRSRMIAVQFYADGSRELPAEGWTSDTSIEVYSVDHHKWVLMHAGFNCYYHLGDGIPLSARGVYYHKRRKWEAGEPDKLVYERNGKSWCRVLNDYRGGWTDDTIPDPYLNDHWPHLASEPAEPPLGHREWKDYDSMVYHGSDKVFEYSGEGNGTVHSNSHVLYDEYYVGLGYPQWPYLPEARVGEATLNWSVNEIHVDAKLRNNALTLTMSHNVQQFGRYEVKVGRDPWIPVTSPHTLALDKAETIKVRAKDVRGMPCSNTVVILLR